MKTRKYVALTPAYRDRLAAQEDRRTLARLLPVFDPAWPPALWEKWFDLFERLAA